MAGVLWGWESYFGHLQGFLESSCRRFQGASEEYIDHAIEQLAGHVRTLTHIRSVFNSAPSSGLLSTRELSTVNEYSRSISELLEVVRSLSLLWERHLDDLHATPTTAYHVPTDTGSRERGRPRFIISRHQLEYLASLSFTWSEVASLLGVSRMTVYRRRREFDLLEARATISDAQLHRLLQHIRTESPNSGEVLVWGRLRGEGYQVTRHQLRRAIRATDPINTALRGPAGLVTRRPYSVPGPNSLWHIG